ncbi:hypothetical protein [Kineosporia succinea]|uniref:Uncharacterized protein n=1 Tax=Kineosporia succinea TaxID=84632 RepID=A0ABT9P2R2_9ACTN|nr:hypothetical protein [Kineosporia succinea]MDP9826976.1 hypothetical protein [Kineosporia succinea]
MASDLIGRRQMMQQRLDRVRDLELAIREQVDLISSRVGMTVEQFDFDGSFRASLASLAGLAARRPTFDIVLTVPSAPLGVRIQQLHGEVKVEVIELENAYAGDVRPRPTGAPSVSAAPSMPAAQSMPSMQPAASMPVAPQPQPATATATVGPQSMSEPGRQVIRGSLIPQSSGPITEPLGVVSSSITDAMPGASSEDLVVSDLAALLWEGLGDADGRP